MIFLENSLGRIVQQGEYFPGITGGIIQLPVSGISSGVYTVCAIVNGKCYYRMFIKN